MATVQLVAPTSEPVTLAEVLAHLRLDTSNFEPAPDAPTVALVPAAAGNVDNGAHRYLITFVTADGQTQAGTISAAVTVVDHTTTGKVALTAIPTGGSVVTARKIYRTQAGGTSYLYLATISDNTTTTYTDNIADSSLGAGAPTTNTTGDPMLNLRIVAAREDAENITRRALVTQQWKLVMDQFPRPSMNVSSANWYGPQWGISPGPLSVVRPDGTTGYEIILPYPPLQTVESIQYYDQTTELLTLLDPSQYIVDTVTEPARIVPAYGVTWPATLNRINAVQIAFTCGYGSAANVPVGIKRWILLRIGSLNEYTEEVALMNRGKIQDLPFVDGLLDKYRVITY